MRNLKIASMQVKVSENAKGNVEQLKQIMEKQEINGIDLVTLPEMFICPYRTSDFPIYAETEGGETWKACSRLASKYKVYLSAGSIPEKDENGCIYNTAYVFDRDGQQIAKHRKMHLFDISVSGGQYFKESDVLTAGNQVTVFDTEFGKMGLCICYDLRFPELSRLMALEGAKVILVPAAFNMTTGPAHWELLFRQRAIDNQVYVVGTAPARDMSGGYISWGHSIITDPWGEIVMQMEEREEIRFTEIDLEKLDKVRSELPLLKHRREDVYEVKKWFDEPVSTPFYTQN